MKKLLNYIPFHFLLCLILGITLQHSINLWYYSEETLFAVIFLFFVALFLIKRRNVFTIFSWLIFFLVGVGVTYLDDDRNKKNYFEKASNPRGTSTITIHKVLKSSVNFNKYEARVIRVDGKKTSGKILLNVRKNGQISFKVDDQILISSSFVEVKSALNPHQFDYKQYLSRQGIHKQVYLNENRFLLIGKEDSFLGSIATIRERIQVSLKKEGFTKNQFAVINALLLGQRQEISRELTEDYSKAGAIHILAVSGLHVGIILLILSSLLKPLERIKNGKLIKLFLIVLSLWFFALLAGMSASVVRAVTMFSAVAIGIMLNQKNSIEQSLVFSMFLLLLFKPMFLFDVGFQLSYLAVFGIVTIQPLLISFWKPKVLLLNKAWQLVTVSIAAQLSVLPLSLFYFHQFPGLFLVSNLVIVPFLGFILIGGIVIIVLSVFSLLPSFMVKVYGSIISLTNDFVSFISQQEAFLLSEIPFSLSKMLFCYLLIVFGIRFFMKRDARRFLFFLSSIVLFQLTFLIEKYQVNSKEEFIVFHNYQSPIFGIRQGSILNVITKKKKIDYVIKPYKIGEQVKVTLEKRYLNYFSFKEKKVLIIDSLGVFNINGLISPVVYLKNSPKINLNRLIEKLHPTYIVADGSNYRSLLKKWKATCLETKTPFWSTSQNGAYILK